MASNFLKPFPTQTPPEENRTRPTQQSNPQPSQNSGRPHA